MEDEGETVRKRPKAEVAGNQGRRVEDYRGFLPIDALEDEPEEDEKHENARGAAAREGDDPQDVFPKLLPSDYGTNSPTSKASRQLLFANRGVWANIKRIKNPALREKLEPDALGQLRRVVSGHTHVCVICWRRIICSRDWTGREGGFITTTAVRHNRAYHQENGEAKRFAARSIFTSSSSTSSSTTASSATASSSNASSAAGLSATASSSSSKPQPSPSSLLRDKALAGLARFCVYSEWSLSAINLNDELFRGVIQAYHKSGGGRGDAPILTPKELEAWVNSEYSVFLLYTKYMINHLLEYSKGNPAALRILENVTLNNGLKFMAMGYEFIDPWLHKKHVLCSGTSHYDYGYEVEVVAMLEQGFHEVFQHKIGDICGDTAEVSVDSTAVDNVDYERKRSRMLESETIVRIMCGDLVQSRSDEQSNTFAAGEALADRFNEVAWTFSQNTYFQALMELGSEIEGGVARKRPKINSSDSLVVSRRTLFRSMIRLNKALDLYATKNHSSWKFEEEHWDAAVELMAFFEIAQNLMALSKQDNQYTSALRFPLVSRALACFRSSDFNVVNWRAVTASTELPHVPKSRESLTALGAEALKLATLEMERCYCGNISNELSGAPVLLTTRDMLATVLDLRTVSCLHLLDRPDVRHDCKALLKVEYVKYALCAHLYDKEKAAAQAAAKAAAGDSADLVSSSSTEKESAAAASQTSAWSSDEEMDGKDSAADESVADSVAAQKAALEISPSAREALEKRFEVEFDSVFKNYRRLGESIDWQSLSAELELGLKPPKNGTKHDVVELLHVDMGKVMKHLCIVPDKNCALYGYLPKMATASRGSIGASCASGFKERLTSCASDVLADGESLYSQEAIEKIAVLRMNSEFMKFMRSTFPEVSQQRHNMTIIKPGEIDDEEEAGATEGTEPEDEISWGFDGGNSVVCL